jgi:microcystin-dependent protein
MAVVTNVLIIISIIIGITALSLAIKNSIDRKKEDFITSQVLTEIDDTGNISKLTTIDLQTTIEDAINDANGPLLPYTARSGMIVMWSTPNPPAGWVICNGSGLLSDGITPVPNLTGRFPYGIVGQTGFAAQQGARSVTLTTDNIPAHAHSQNNTPQKGHADGCQKTCWGGESCSNICDYTGLMTGQTGGGQEFSIIPPYTAVYFIIKL